MNVIYIFSLLHLVSTNKNIENLKKKHIYIIYHILICGHIESFTVYSFAYFKKF